MTLEPPFVKVTQTGAVLRLTLSRPEQRNPLSLGMLSALSAEIDAAASDPGIAVIVIAAEGPVFSAGHDLKELTAARSSDDHGEAFFRETFAACEALMLSISNGPKPVIAVVQGLATAAGCQLVAACDIVIATTEAKFATPGVNIGLFCSTPAVPLIRSIGPKQARLMLFTGEPISAQAALATGLVSEVVLPEALEKRAEQVALIIAGKSSRVVSFGKRTLIEQEQLPLREAYAKASHAMVINLLYDDAKSGLSKFLERKSH
jgi:enoyl-CoA hydratase/carnithine racemase